MWVLVSVVLEVIVQYFITWIFWVLWKQIPRKSLVYKMFVRDHPVWKRGGWRRVGQRKNLKCTVNPTKPQPNWWGNLEWSIACNSIPPQAYVTGLLYLRFAQSPGTGWPLNGVNADCFWSLPWRADSSGLGGSIISILQMNMLGDFDLQHVIDRICLSLLTQDLVPFPL